jgi:hypothetical protein
MNKYITIIFDLSNIIIFLEFCLSDTLFIVFKKKYREESDMKDKIITGNKPAPGSTLLNKLFKIDGLKIKDIHPNKEQHVKIIVTIINSNFSLNLIPIKNILG